ncbi:MAG: NADPH:quinone oxidoreductase [Deltaproteobacteria bacterium]|jgi:putative PIG3 family NAD(P)H quinone oxidoreductase|nr:NADPH:quinone oxidoreductase [Deltaproteobacteria bacterium]
MRAIVVDDPGRESSLRLAEVPEPELAPGGVRLRVAAFAVNRGDLLQRQGLYPPPPGASEILGLECAGEIVEVAGAVDGWKVGDRAMALLPGGGYAEQVVVPTPCLMPVPDRLTLEQAAALPEVFLTVHQNVFQQARLPDGGALLVHGGASGIGTAAIQMAREVGAQVLVTAGSDEKCARCRELGASVAVNYRTSSFAEAVAEATGGAGVDVVLDHIGAAYLADNLVSLKVGGRLAIIGLMSGAKAEINLGLLLTRRLQVIGSTLRARSLEEKGALIREFQERFGGALAEGRIAPVVDRVLPMAEIEKAHEVMRASGHFGKLVLAV